MKRHQFYSGLAWRERDGYVPPKHGALILEGGLVIPDDPALRAEAEAWAEAEEKAKLYGEDEED